MADDIDIEEHDVLDNPAIKNMFPDISVLKKEISQFFEEEPEVKQEPALLESCSKKMVKTTVQITKMTELADSQDSNIAGKLLKNQNRNKNVNNNKIILGSKPSKPSLKDCHEDSMKLYKAKVLLQDIHTYLDKSKTYCKDCLILFPKKLSLHKHLNKFHLDKNNTNVKSKIMLGTIKSKTNYKCYLCNKFFSSRSNLGRHNKNIHNSNTPSSMPTKNYEQIKSRLRKKKNISKEVKSVSNHGCFHCQKSFPDQKSLIEHLYNVLDPLKIECHECTEKFATHEKLSQHISAKHNKQQNSSNNIEKMECEVNIENDNEPLHNQNDIVKVKQDKKQSKNMKSRNLKKFKSNSNIYQCSICTYCFNSIKMYTRHINNKHKIKQNNKVKKVVFNSQCKYCPSKSINIMAYNTHLSRYHKNKVDHKFITKNKTSSNQQKKVDACAQLPNNRTLKINEQSECRNMTNELVNSYSTFALKSVLFKCNKCDIHFLSSNVARKHLDHMEMLINWKCSICQRIFKKNDEVFHLKQHSLCDEFTVYDLCESALAKVLYNCSKCTIHYTEESYFRHYVNCESETPNSIYCKYCDLLIDKSIMDSHEYHHKHKNNKSTDFTIIESDAIFDKEENIADNLPASNLIKERDEAEHSINGIGQRKRLFEQIFSMSYCQTCKCFLSDMALSRKAHVKSRCAHIPKHVCGYCGLVLTNKAMDTHRKLHRNTQNLKLQDYKFYDLNGKRICPPVPEYPRCDICGIHFLTKVAVKGHICSEEEYLTCHICQMKLSESVFKLHMSFHNYSLNKAKNPMLRPSTSEILEPQSDPKMPTTKKLNKTGTPICDTPRNLDCVRFNILYSCKSCLATLDTYDKVIEHCQYHYSHKDNNLILIRCPKCCYKFDRECYENHQQLHTLKISVKVVNFDVLYFLSENNIWFKHLFKDVSRDKVQKIFAESVYQFERRIKMEITQKGPPHLTLYKCNKCNNFIDPINVYKHVETSCHKVRKHPCSICGVPLISSASRIEHEKLHKLYNVGLKSYNIVTFNKNEDNFFCLMNRYVLYQCRNCDGIVDRFQCKNHECNGNNLKKCIYCGLLLYNEDYDSHVAKHNDIDTFNVENIKVVLFGEKKDTDDFLNKTLMSTFNGMLYDYILYKCKNCKICVKNEQCTLKHVCYFDDFRSKCPKCDLYFYKRTLKHHLNLHEVDSLFQRDNLKVITFDLSITPQGDMSSKKISNNGFKVTQVETQNVSEAVKTEPVINTAEKAVKIYKCACGLHFLEELKSRIHSNHCNSRKRTKQNCSKCGLLFTPSELFAHLLAHHGDKSHVYKLDVVEISPKDETVIYKCLKCNLHFMESDKAMEHKEYCVGTENGGEKCGKCNLSFHSSSLTDNHYENCRKYYKVIFIGESTAEMTRGEVTETKTDGMENLLLEADLVRDSCYNFSRESLSKIDVTKYDNTIYKCNECNVHYITKDTMRRHIAVGKHDLLSIQDVCNICGLNFSLQSLAKHMYVHHEQLKLTLTDLIISDSMID